MCYKWIQCSADFDNVIFCTLHVAHHFNSLYNVSRWIQYVHSGFYRTFPDPFFVLAFCFVSKEPKPLRELYPSLSKPCYITETERKPKVLKMTANSNVSPKGARKLLQPLIYIQSFIIWCLSECQHQMKSIYHLSTGMSAKLSIDHLD